MMEFPTSYFNKLHEMVYEMHGKIYVQPYVNQALLQINIHQNCNCPTTFSGSLSHEILTEPVI
jgi:hypothetical protein